MKMVIAILSMSPVLIMTLFPLYTPEQAWCSSL